MKIFAWGTDEYDNNLKCLNEIVTKTKNRAGCTKGPVLLLESPSINIDIFIGTFILGIIISVCGLYHSGRIMK